jgi:hypothetical protein
MNIDIQHGRGHAAWTYSIDFDMQNGHGHAARTLIWTRTDRDMGADTDKDNFSRYLTETRSVESLTIFKMKNK